MSAPAVAALLLAKTEIARAASRVAHGPHRYHGVAYRAKRILEEGGRSLTQRIRAVDLQRIRREDKA